jgi:hypothetical protein
VGIFEFRGTLDSVLVGLETEDRDQTARAASYAGLSAERDQRGLLLSDLAFLTRVGFDPSRGAYRRAYGSGVPNPGHLYHPTDPIGFSFEAYHLATDERGFHRAQVSVTVKQRSRRGWFDVLIRTDKDQPEAELQFTVSEAGETLIQLLSLDVPTLRPGRYLLTVLVEDLEGGETAVRSEQFVVEEPR